MSPAIVALALDLSYAEAATIGGPASAHPFRRSLVALAVGPSDRIYVLGDEEVRVFEGDFTFLRSFKAPAGALCLAVGPEGHVYLGSPGRVDVFDASGQRVSGFGAGEPGKPAYVTSLKLFRGEVLVGDARARFIRRYDATGRPLGEIGAQTRTGGFMLPNGVLDFDVDAKGVVRAGDTGRHRVSAWGLDGSPMGSFGKFGFAAPEDFVGCCNPVNLAVTPDGKIVTGEKMAARVKVYDAGGRLLALIGPDHFDAGNTHFPIAVDSKGRVLVADPERRVVKVFVLSSPPK